MADPAGTNSNSQLFTSIFTTKETLFSVDIPMGLLLAEQQYHNHALS